MLVLENGPPAFISICRRPFEGADQAIDCVGKKRGSDDIQGIVNVLNQDKDTDDHRGAGLYPSQGPVRLDQNKDHHGRNVPGKEEVFDKIVGIDNKREEGVLQEDQVFWRFQGEKVNRQHPEPGHHAVRRHPLCDHLRIFIIGNQRKQYAGVDQRKNGPRPIHGLQVVQDEIVQRESFFVRNDFAEKVRHKEAQRHQG